LSFIPTSAYQFFELKNWYADVGMKLLEAILDEMINVSKPQKKFVIIIWQTCDQKSLAKQNSCIMRD